MNGGHQRAVIEIGCPGDIIERPGPQALLTMMIAPFRGDKRSSAGGAHRGGNFRKSFKAGFAESKPMPIVRLLQEFAANGTSRRIDEVHQLGQDTHFHTNLKMLSRKGRSIIVAWSTGVLEYWNADGTTVEIMGI
jgi:hypothetical protein